MNEFDHMIKIADIHANRIKEAIDALQLLFPLSKEKVLTLSYNDMLFIELLVGRFAKLQDYIGQKLINEFLKIAREYDDSLAMLDKLHKLERLSIIESVSLWDDMRKARNHISHEYPDKPDLTAIYLNQIYNLAPKLLQLLGKIKYMANIYQTNSLTLL